MFRIRIRIFLGLRDLLVRGTDPRIRIRTNMSRIRSTGERSGFRQDRELRLAHLAHDAGELELQGVPLLQQPDILLGQLLTPVVLYTTSELEEGEGGRRVVKIFVK